MGEQIPAIGEQIIERAETRQLRRDHREQLDQPLRVGLALRKGVAQRLENATEGVLAVGAANRPEVTAQVRYEVVQRAVVREDPVTSHSSR